MNALSVLLTLLVVVIVVGFAMWLIDALIPMDPKLKTIAKAIVGIIGLLYIIAMLLGAAPMLAVK